MSFRKKRHRMLEEKSRPHIHCATLRNYRALKREIQRKWKRRRHEDAAVSSLYWQIRIRAKPEAFDMLYNHDKHWTALRVRNPEKYRRRTT